MKRAGTFLLVAAAHALIVAALIGGGPCRPTSGTRPFAAGDDRNDGPGSAANQVDRESGAGYPRSDSSPGESAIAGTNGSGGPATRGLSPLKSSGFAATNHAPPDDLVQRATRQCRAAVVVDWTEKRLLYSRAAQQALPLASLTKMMTALVVAEQIRQNPAWSWDREVPVTKAAWRIGGSQVWLDPRETFSVAELMKAMMIFSANDAAYLLAEAAGDGDTGSFIGRMNRMADRLGLSSMHFSNPHGLPEGQESADNRGTALECAFLAGQLLAYPRIVDYSSTRLAWLRENSDKPLQLLNRNALVGSAAGVNGMKTGFTARAGFCIAATCVRNGRSLIVVLLGCDTKDERNELARDFLDWGYSTLQ